MLINPNPMWLVDTVTIAKVSGQDKYQKPTYDDPVSFAHVRFDRSATYSGTGNDRAITKVGTVFIYAFNQTRPLPSTQDWLHAKVIDATGDEFLVQTVTPHQQDISAALYCVELGVL